MTAEQKLSREPSIESQGEKMGIESKAARSGGECAAVVGGPLESQREGAVPSLLPLSDVVTVVRHCLIRFAPNCSGLLQTQIDNARTDIERALVDLATALALSSEPTTPEGIHDGALSLNGKRDHPASGGDVRENRGLKACFSYDDEARLYYFAPMTRAPGPFKEQRQGGGWPSEEEIARALDPEAFEVVGPMGSSAQHWIEIQTRQRRMNTARTQAKAIRALSTPREWKIQEGMKLAWQPIETAPKNKLILVGWFNELGKWRSAHAQYRDDLPQHDDADDDDELAPAGWYEGSLEAEMLWQVYPKYWHPLLSPPLHETVIPLDIERDHHTTEQNEGQRR